MQIEIAFEATKSITSHIDKSKKEIVELNLTYFQDMIWLLLHRTLESFIKM